MMAVHVSTLDANKVWPDEIYQLIARTHTVLWCGCFFFVFYGEHWTYYRLLIIRKVKENTYNVWHADERNLSQRHHPFHFISLTASHTKCNRDTPGIFLHQIKHTYSGSIIVFGLLFSQICLTNRKVFSTRSHSVRANKSSQHYLLCVFSISSSSALSLVQSKNYFCSNGAWTKANDLEYVC